jgi:hypothetical protein
MANNLAKTTAMLIDKGDVDDNDYDEHDNHNDCYDDE